MATDTGRPAQAIRGLRRALDALDRLDALDGPDRFDGLDGLDALDSAAPTPARSHFLDDRVRVHLALSTAEFERGGAEVSLEHAERALALSAHDPALRAMCHSQLSNVWGRSDQPARARAELDLAAAGLDLLRPRERWVILVNRGMVSLDLAQVQSAERDFEAAADLAAAHGMPRQEFMARHNLGYAAYVGGDLPRALSLMTAADAMPDDTSRAASRLDHGRVMLEAGLVREAIGVLSDARDLCERDGLRQLRGETDVELARGYLMMGEYDRSVRHARAARQSFRRRGARGWRDWAQLWEWAAMLAQEHRPARWRSVAVSVQRIAADHPGTRLGLEASLTAAQVQLRLGDVAGARAWLTRAEPIAGIGSLTALLRLRLTQADAACAAGDTRTTTRVLRQAARELTAAQSNSGSLDVRTATALHAVALARFDLRLAHGRGAAAMLTSTERWQAPSAQIPSVRPPEDPELASRIAELRRLTDQMRDERGGGSLGDVARARRLEQAISRRGWMLADGSAASSGGPAYAPRTADDLARAKEALRADGATLASFFPLDGRLGAVVVDARRVRMHDVADLRVIGSIPPGDLRTAVAASLAADLRRIEQLVLTALRVDGRLVVVPCAAVEGLPWGMLPTRRGQPTTIAPSLTTWAKARQAGAARAATPGRPRVVALSGPELGAADAEVAAVAAVWGSAGTSYPDGTTADLSNALTSAQVVHVAAHGLHHAQSPLFSSVRMVDGPLFTFDLQHTGVSAGHVVLSACDVGQSSWRPGEERLGLAAGLLALGARSVVASVCRIPDEVAGAVMPGYHRRLAAGMEAAEALAATCADADPLAGAFVAMGGPWRAPTSGSHALDAPGADAPSTG